MNIKIKLDKKLDTPVYRQIIEQITLLVRDGKLNAGDRLPPERELSETLEVSRGTIKRAYEKLAVNNIIEMTRGRGSFISSEQNVVNGSRKDMAVKVINRALVELDKLKFDSREISSMFQILQMEHEQRRESIHIAGIDCNPEALSIFDRQLRYISNVQLFRFLLDDLSREGDIKRRLAEFDIILTTTTHYAEIIGMAPELRSKIIQVVVSPDQQTIIDLAKISPSAQVGILTQSRNFLKIIKNKLTDFQLNTKKLTHLYEKELDRFPEFIKPLDVLITYPGCTFESRKEFQNSLQAFRENGGSIIKFEYQIERSALMHIEEKISNLITARATT